MSIQNPLGPISYTDKDFESVYVELLDLVKQLTYKWDPSVSNESDPGVILLKLNAIIADKINYNIDSNILECFPETVAQLSNARQLFAQLGYMMKWYQSASTIVSLKYIGNETSVPSYTIPKFTMLTDTEREVIYSIIGATTTSSTDVAVTDVQLLTDGTISSALIMEGVATNYSINGETNINVSHLDTKNRLYFDTNMVAENGVFITNSDNTNYNEWVRKDNLLVEEPGQTIYRFGTTDDGSYCYLEFPEDAELLFKNGINITYLRTDGLSGNMAANVLNDFYYSFSPIEDTSVTINSDNVKVTNIYSAVDGKDPETIEEGYKNYKRVIGTFETLVTLRDYLNYVLTSQLVSNGFVCDRTNDLQDTYNIITVKDSILSSIHMIENDAIPGYLDSGTFYGGKIVVSSTNVYYNPYTQQQIGSSYCYDLDTEKVYKIVNGSFSEVDSVPTFNAFSLKLYLLQYMPSVTTASGHSLTFNMLSNNQQDTVKDYLQDVKSLQHDFKDLEAPNSISSHFCFFKNKFPIDCRITTQYPLSGIEAQEMLAKIKSSLYNKLSSKEVDFGTEVTLEDVKSIILESDARIKDANMANIEFTTYAVYYDPSLEGSSYPFVEVEISTPGDTVDVDYNFQNNDSMGVGVDPQIFMSKIGDINYQPTTFVYSGSIWSINGSQQNPTDYGLYFKYTQSFSSTANQTSYTVLHTINRLESVTRSNIEISGCTFTNSSSSGTITLPTPSSSGSPVVITYWSTQGTSLASGDMITGRISYKTQFRDEIFAKSILAGKTPLVVSGNKYTHRYDQTYNSNRPNNDASQDKYEVNDVSYLQTNVDITVNNSNNQYLLRDNESIQFYSPNLIDVTSYSNYVKFEFYTPSAASKVVNADTNYQLHENEYLFLYWKDTDEADAYYRFAAYGEGHVMCPTFEMKSTNTSIGGPYLQGPTSRSSDKFVSTDNLGYLADLSSDITLNLTSAANILSGTKTITIKEINEVTLTSSDGCYCYWILNETSEDLQYYEFPVNHGLSITNDRLLDAGEYFIYSNADLSEMYIMGTGTKVHIVEPNPEIDVWRVKVLDSSVILNSGASALANYWKEIPNEGVVNLTENKIYTLNSGTTFRLVNDDLVSWTRVFDRTGVKSGSNVVPTNTSKTIDSWSDSNRVVTFSQSTVIAVSSVTYTVADEGTITITNYTFDETNQTCTVDAGVIPSGATVVIRYTYTTTVNSTTESPLTLSGFTISYLSPETNSWVYLPQMELSNNGHAVSWNAQSLLNLNIGPDKEQILLQNQTVKFQLASSDSFSSYIIEGDDKEDNHYQTALISSMSINSDGSSDKLPTYIVDSDGNRTYLDLLVYQKQLSTDEVVYGEDDVKIKLTAGSTYKSINFILPKGVYIIPFSNTNEFASSDNLYVQFDGNNLSSLNSSQTDLKEQRTYFLTFEVTSNKITSNHTLTVRRTLSNEEITITLQNPFLYTHTEGINDEYFQRMLTLIPRFDKDNIFNYTYQVHEDDLIEDPLDAASFMNPNHIYNKFTICQLDTTDNTSIYIAGKK